MTEEDSNQCTRLWVKVPLRNLAVVVLLSHLGMFFMGMLIGRVNWAKYPGFGCILLLSVFVWWDIRYRDRSRSLEQDL